MFDPQRIAPHRIRITYLESWFSRMGSSDDLPTARPSSAMQQEIRTLIVPTAELPWAFLPLRQCGDQLCAPQVIQVHLRIETVKAP